MSLENGDVKDDVAETPTLVWVYRLTRSEFIIACAFNAYRPVYYPSFPFHLLSVYV